MQSSTTSVSMADKKYCTGCQTLRSQTEGEKVKRGKATRWICNFCKAKTNKSIYASKTRNK
jgi:ribosomal protein L37AE/L43A